MWLIGLLIFACVCAGLVLFAIWSNKRNEERYGGDDNEGYQTNPNKERK